MVRSLALALTLLSTTVQARTMVEQFYVDHTGARVSRGTDHSPIAYNHTDQRFFFLGHFGYVDVPSFRTSDRNWYPEGFWYPFGGTSPTFSTIDAPPIPDPRPTPTGNPPVAVSEPSALALFFTMVILLLTARRKTV